MPPPPKKKVMNSLSASLSNKHLFLIIILPHPQILFEKYGQYKENYYSAWMKLVLHLMNVASCVPTRSLYREMK